MEKKKTPKQGTDLFEAIIKASVSGNPKPKPKKKPKK
jgi:hypothetical protein